MIGLVGVLPVSALNIGIVLALPAIQSQIEKILKQIEDINFALAKQLEYAINRPSPPDIIPGIAGQLASLPDLIDPAKIITYSGDVQADIAKKLGLIAAQIAIVGEIDTVLGMGLSAGSLSLWTYSGRASSFGARLEADTQNGYPGVAADAPVYALLIATESFESWGNFSTTFNTGKSSLRKVENTEQADLQFEGTLTADKINTGVKRLSEPIRLYLLDLEGAKLNLEFALQASIGINLPPLPSLAIPLLSLDINMVLGGLTFAIDLMPEITGLNLQLNKLLELVASLNVVLSAGGLALWVYSGPAKHLGSEFRTAIENGVPGGSGPGVPAYGVAIATNLPSAWASFGAIFATS